MFYVGPSVNYDGRVTVIGEFVKIDGSYVVLKVGAQTVKVQHNGLDNYKTKYIFVTGVLENGILTEESTHKVDDDFDFSTFLRLAKASTNYADVFQQTGVGQLVEQSQGA